MAIATFAVVALVAAVVAAAARRMPTRAGTAPQDLASAPATGPRIAPAGSDSVLATGNIRLVAGARIEVGAQISGRVRRLLVRQGTHVRAGDIIAQLDTAETRALVDQATAQVLELRALERQAAEDAGRTEALGAVRVASPQELAAARSAAAQAGARLRGAEAAEQLARTRLGYTTIRAPIAGVVASVTTHEGEAVAASLSAPTFVTLIDPTRLECVALVDETDIGRVALGDSASFSVDAYPALAYHGVVDRIAPDATIVGGVVDYEVTLRLVGSTEGLKPQMTTSVTIMRRQAKRPW